MIEIPRTEHGWALRAYLVLIGCAFRGETISDGEMTQAIQCGNQLVLQRALKYVVRWCTLTNQPHIASLVVESITGMPVPSFSVVPRDPYLQSTNACGRMIGLRISHRRSKN